MGQSHKVLGQLNPSATTLTTLYTVPAATQVIASTIQVCNRSAVPTSFRISVAVAGAGDDPKQYVAYDTPIQGNDMVPVTLHITLGAGDVVRAYATLATLSFNMFGVEIS